MRHSPRIFPLAGALLVWAMTATAAPRLQVAFLQPADGEFGRQTTNAGSYPFICRLQNSGDQPLHLLSVRSGCPCLSVSLPKRELAPGETMVLTGVLTTTAYEGHVAKTIFIRTNDDQAGMQTLRLHVFVPYCQSGLRFQPGSGCVKSQTVDGKVRLKAAPLLENCNPSGVITVTGIKLPAGWQCKTPLPVAIRAESTERLELVAENGDSQPYGNRTVTLLTDARENPEWQGVLHDAKPDALRPPVSAGSTPPADEDCDC